MQGLKFQNFKSRLDLIHRNWKRSLSLRNSGSFLENDNQIKSKIKSLNDHVSFTGTISKNILLNTIKSIKQYKKCDSDTALALIKFCDLRLIDFLPKERQNLLNNLFENVFPNLNVIYNHNHFDSYIESTISNRNSFDVFKISREMHAKNILPTMNTNNYFIKTLCESGEINIALLHLKFLIESKTISLFDLNSYKNQPQNSQELYESLLHNLNLHSNTAQDRVNANLINPVLQYYFLANNAEKAIKIFKQISTRNIKPNNITYFNLINGYIHLQEFEEAEKLFNKTKDQLLTIDKLSLFSSLDKIREKSLVETVLTSIPEQLETRERIFIISEINYFCERKLFEKAYSLLQNFFYHEFREKDPIRKDLILTKTDVTDYFCRSLVLNSTDNLESVDTLIRFADLLDKENVSTQYYLTRMIYHSFSLSNIDLSLKLISQLKSKGIRVKINHVLPLVKQEANRLEIKILSMKSQENNKIEELPEYKSLVKIIGKIKELGCLGERSEIELDILINCLKLDSENNFKSYLNFYDLFIMLKSSKIVISDVEIFNECAYKLLRSVGNSLKKENIDEIQYYLKDFQNLIKQMSKNTIENDIQKNFYKYLKRLLDLSLGKSFDYKHSLIFNIAELLNKNGVDSVYSKLIYELLLEHYSELFKNDFKEKKELQTYLRKNFNSLFINKKLSNELMDNYNSYPKEKLEEILKNQPNNFPLIRVLLIKMLNIKTRNPIIAKRIQQLVKELPDDEITPMVCENLQNYYAHLNEPKKSKFYFWKMLEKRNEQSSYTVNSKWLILFVEKQFKRRNFTHEIIEIFKKLTDKKMLVPIENNSKESTRLNKFLIENVFESSIPEEFKALIETIYQSNFIKRNSTLTEYAMLKLIENQKFDEALEYYKFNLKEHRQSVLEILLLSHLLSNKSKYANKINEVVENFDTSLGNNALFFGYLVNSDFEAASEIFSNKMECHFDIKVLERFVYQCSFFKEHPSKLSKYRHSRHLETILKFLKQKNSNLYNDAKSVIRSQN